MLELSNFYSAAQLCLLLAPFGLLLLGIWVWVKFRRRSAVFAWTAILAPVILFLAVGVTTFAGHSARTSFLNDLIVIPDRITPGRTLAVKLYQERPDAFHLTRIGIATEVIVALDDNGYQSALGADAILNLNTLKLATLAEFGEADLPFSGAPEDIDYVYVSGHLADFIAIDPKRWGSLNDLGYDLGLVSLIYDVSDDQLISLVTSKPIYRFASTRSVYFRLPNWSTDWSLEKLFEWEDFTPSPIVGNTRFDVLADRVVPTE